MCIYIYICIQTFKQSILYSEFIYIVHIYVNIQREVYHLFQSIYSSNSSNNICVHTNIPGIDIYYYYYIVRMSSIILLKKARIRCKKLERLRCKEKRSANFNCSASRLIMCQKTFLYVKTTLFNAILTYYT